MPERACARRDESEGGPAESLMVASVAGEGGGALVGGAGLSAGSGPPL